MPVHVIPLHMFALRKTGIVFRKDAIETCVQPFWVEDEEETTQTNEALQTAQESRRGGNVVDAILQRVDQAAATETLNSNTERERKTRHMEYRDAVKSWLEALRREMKDSKNAAVVLAAMEHLWEFLLDDKEKVSIRRTCLHLGSRLLEKSADARRWFLEESNRLGKWTEAMVNTRKEQKLSDQLFQREGFVLLQHLASMGYGELYPRLNVAMQRLQQQFPWIEEEVSSESMVAAGLTQLRHLRDLALQHWEKERNVVRRILDRSDACMKTLVPRVGEESCAAHGTEPAALTQVTSNDNDKDDDDDEDIEWEDGFMEDEEEDDEVTTRTEHAEESHAEAVERTLAVMQSSARMRAGQLEIAFDDTTEGPTTVTPQVVNARARLEKCVGRLTNRHVDRLNVWIDALTRADNLVEGEDGSLTQMTADARQLKRETLQSALQLKADVSSCLSSAKRLVDISLQAESKQESVMSSPAVASLDMQSVPRNERLATALNRSRPRVLDHSRKRSAKIRIKYAK